MDLARGRTRLPITTYGIAASPKWELYSLPFFSGFNYNMKAEGEIASSILPPHPKILDHRIDFCTTMISCDLSKITCDHPMHFDGRGSPHLQITRAFSSVAPLYIFSPRAATTLHHHERPPHPFLLLPYQRCCSTLFSSYLSPTRATQLVIMDSVGAAGH
jgi:hypothetical protein